MCVCVCVCVRVRVRVRVCVWCSGLVHSEQLSLVSEAEAAVWLVSSWQRECTAVGPAARVLSTRSAGGGALSAVHVDVDDQSQRRTDVM